MIVKNESANLAQCLTSVKDLVDEIVVLDTGSGDRTLEIAKEFGAIAAFQEWGEDFAAARNKALKLVTGDWVLVLDGDEIFNINAINDVNSAIAQENTLVVNLIRHEIGASQSPYSAVSRLFRNHPAIKFARPYHETIDDSVLELLKQEPHWNIVELPIVSILHSGYTPESLQTNDKASRAKSLLEKAFKENPNDPYVCSKLGALYLQLGQEKEGLKLLKQGLKANTASVPISFELHYHLANAYLHQKKWELANKHYQKAINQPILTQLKIGAFNNFAGLLQSVGDLKNAQTAYETILKIDPTFAVGYFNLAMLLKGKGQLQDAIALYQKAINLNPNYAEAYQNLGVTCFKAGLLQESLEAFKKAISLYESQQSPEAEKLTRSLEEMGMI
jgi:glycosyltransferase involved in cell wall biosynthesis